MSSSFCNYLAMGSVSSGPRCPDFTTTTRLDKTGFLIVASEGWGKKKGPKVRISDSLKLKQTHFTTQCRCSRCNTLSLSNHKQKKGDPLFQNQEHHSC